MYDDVLLEDALRNQEAATARRPDPESRVRRLQFVVAVTIAGVALLAAIVAGAVCWIVAGAVVGVVVLVVVALVLAGLGAWAVFRPRPDVLATAVGGRPADPERDARLLNLIEGLCMATGLRPPEVRVIEADGLNALTLGRSPSSATLAVTTGLVKELSRIELEGVLAALVAAIRTERLVPATIIATLPPVLAHRLGQPASDDVEVDRAAVALTRYPPGLIGALQQMAEQGTAVAAHSVLDEFWFAAPRPGPRPARRSLEERIEALSEL